MTDSSQCTARFTDDLAAVLIEHLTIRDRDVVREAQRWTTGERGPAVADSEALTSANLTSFAAEALRLGAHALTVTGQARESHALEHMLKDVGDRTSRSTTQATEATQRAAQDAADAMSKAAREAQRAIADADARSRKEFTTAVDTAKQSMHAELQRIFGGERPDLLERLRPVLDAFGRELDTKAKAGTTELVDKVVKQFDPNDPKSPIAKHVQQLSTHQSELIEKLNEQHTAVSAKLDELATAVKVQEATTSLANVTPLKGDSYADRVHGLMRDIASGLGDDYDDTSASTGNVPRSKKGDGVLTVNGGVLRVVLEMTDSERRGWSDYLDEAERNRDALASLGLVRSPEQNGG